MLCWKLYGKAGEVVIRVGEEAEGAMVSSENVTNEQQPKSLALWFGGEEGCEEMRSHRWWDATAVVDDGELARDGIDGYDAL